MATNNNGNLLDSAGNVFVDFVWGNFPMQPNDERTTTADYTTAPSTVVSAANASGDYGWGAWTVYPSSRLNPTLSNHSVVEADYAGFPAFASGDGAYISGTAYIQVPNILGLTTANAKDVLRDAGYENANITTASNATNSSKTVTDAARTVSTTTLTFTTGAAHGYVAGNKVTVSSLTDTALNATYTVASAPSSTTFTVTTTATTAIALTGETGGVVAVSGTIKAQSTAAGASSVASTATITITPWA